MGFENLSEDVFTLGAPAPECARPYMCSSFDQYEYMPCITLHPSTKDYMAHSLRFIIPDYIL